MRIIVPLEIDFDQLLESEELSVSTLIDLLLGDPYWLKSRVTKYQVEKLEELVAYLKEPKS